MKKHPLCGLRSNLIGRG